uniref:Ig-like domain-containing protein n=1 Tax=Maylandia zebra TaxID=106582 RepID=A0A3P9DH40_9CICH
MLESTSVRLGLKSSPSNCRWQVRSFEIIALLSFYILNKYHLMFFPFMTPRSEAQSVFYNKDSIQKEVKVTLSQKATLSCEVSDSKTEVKWYKDGKLLSSSKTIHTESKGKNRQLVIDSVEKKDAGEYICEAGTEKLAFKLQVAGRGSALTGF